MNVAQEVRCLIAELWGPQHKGELDTPVFEITQPDVNRLVDLLVVVEKRFGFLFATREIDRIVTAGDLVKVLERKLSEREPVGFW